MRIVLVLATLFTIFNLNGQEQYNVTFDSTYISAFMQENVIVNGSIYAVGGAICSSGECGYLTKYSLNGDVHWTIEYPQIDINSSQVMHYKDERFYITGRAKDSIATKTLVLDTLGNVLDDWNYSVEGATTNFSKEVYYDEDYYYFILTEVIDGDTRGALYKCDYNGNIIDRLVFPHLWFTIPLAVRPYHDNLLVSINHRFNESCPFGQNENDFGATYLAEVDKETMTIIRDKKDVCYRFIANDIYISPSFEIIRTVIISDSLHLGDYNGNLGVIFYDDHWEVKNIIEYPHELAKGVSNMKFTKDGTHYYVLLGENVPQTDGSNWPFGDQLIQKWTSNHELLWEKRYYSHNKMKRLKVKNFLIAENGDLHIVGYVWPDFPQTHTLDFWLFSVEANGCHNGDCRDEVDLDNLVSTSTPLPPISSLSIYPNPSRNTIYLEGVEDNEQVVVLDILGNNVMEFKFLPHIPIDVSNFTNGIYFVKTINHGPVKFIKN